MRKFRFAYFSAKLQISILVERFLKNDIRYKLPAQILKFLQHVPTPGFAVWKPVLTTRHVKKSWFNSLKKFASYYEMLGNKNLSQQLLRKTKQTVRLQFPFRIV